MQIPPLLLLLTGGVLSQSNTSLPSSANVATTNSESSPISSSSSTINGSASTINNTTAVISTFLPTSNSTNTPPLPTLSSWSNSTMTTATTMTEEGPSTTIVTITASRSADSPYPTDESSAPAASPTLSSGATRMTKPGSCVTMGVAWLVGLRVGIGLLGI